MSLGRHLLHVFPGDSRLEVSVSKEKPLRFVTRWNPALQPIQSRRVLLGAGSKVKAPGPPVDGPQFPCRRPLELAAEKHFAVWMNVFSLTIRVWPSGCLLDYNVCRHRNLPGWAVRAVEGTLTRSWDAWILGPLPMTH